MRNPEMSKMITHKYKGMGRTTVCGVILTVHRH